MKRLRNGFVWYSIALEDGELKVSALASRPKRPNFVDATCHRTG